jgi:Flp pilus assembly CpaE family ATPase
MQRNLLFLTGDAKLVARLEAALMDECVVMAVDPRTASNGTAASRFHPDIVVIDASAHTGARTILERMAAIRAQFPAQPLIAIGDEMSAQLILASFRAGVDDFVDRDASDAEIRGAVLARLRDVAAPTGIASLVNILSATPSDEDADLALNIASLLAAAPGERRVLFLDLSLPVTPVRTALGLDFNFTLNTALRDMARLDKEFLDAALARTPDTGLYVLPLTDNEGDTAIPALRDLSVLLQILRSLFDTVVVHWGAFSRQAVHSDALSGVVLIGCNQRFSSVRNAKALLASLRGSDKASAEPILAIQQFDTHLVPSPEDVVGATGARQSLVLRASWAALAQAHNRGVPLALAGPSVYGDALRTRLTELGLLTPVQTENTTLKLLHWLNRTRTG